MINEYEYVAHIHCAIFSPPVLLIGHWRYYVFIRIAEVLDLNNVYFLATVLNHHSLF